MNRLEIKKVLKALQDKYLQKYDWSTLLKLDPDNDRVYYIKKDYKEYVFKLILNNLGSIPWMQSSVFNDKYYDINIYYERVINNYRLCSILNIGAKYYDHVIIGTTLIILTEYLPHKFSKEYAEDNREIITNWIKSIHNLGIYHGDLHNGNIRLTSNFELKLIDLETIFYKDELTDSLIIDVQLQLHDMIPDDSINYELTNPFYFDD